MLHFWPSLSLSPHASNGVANLIDPFGLLQFLFFCLDYDCVCLDILQRKVTQSTRRVETLRRRAPLQETTRRRLALCWASGKHLHTSVTNWPTPISPAMAVWHQSIHAGILRTPLLFLNLSLSLSFLSRILFLIPLFFSFLKQAFNTILSYAIFEIYI